MNAYFIATAIIKNPEQFQEYAKKSAATFEPYKGNVLAKGKFEETLAGSAKHQISAVVGFPSVKELDEWYQSKEYQALIPLRDEAADITISKYLVPTP